MFLKQIAKESLAILDFGSFKGPTGQSIQFKSELEAAVAGTQVFTAEQLANLVQPSETLPSRLRIEVTGETT